MKQIICPYLNRWNFENVNDYICELDECIVNDECWREYKKCPKIIKE